MQDEIYASMTFSGKKFTPFAAVCGDVPVLAAGGLAKQVCHDLPNSHRSSNFCATLTPAFTDVLVRCPRLARWLDHLPRQGQGGY